MKSLEKKEKELSRERRNLIDTIAKNGGAAGSLLPKLGELEVELDQTTREIERLRAELAAIKIQAIDETDLRAALSSFDEIWHELFPSERARILHLLIEEIRYDAEAGEVSITFRPGGVRSLAREDGRETA